MKAGQRVFVMPHMSSCAHVPDFSSPSVTIYGVYYRNRTQAMSAKHLEDWKHAIAKDRDNHDDDDDDRFVIHCWRSNDPSFGKAKWYTVFGTSTLVTMLTPQSRRLGFVANTLAARRVSVVSALSAVLERAVSGAV